MAALRGHFERQDFIHLPRLLAPELLEPVLSALTRTRFVLPEKSDLTSFDKAATPEVAFMISFALHQPAFFAFVEDLTGCPPIKSLCGMALRMRPGCGHYLKWHRDSLWDPGRLATLTLNLSPAPYSGGMLQFRRPGAPNPTSEISNVGLGDAVIFSAVAETEHRNTELVGERDKTSFTGWFYAESGLLAPQFASEPG
jgi:hypothetical protein